MQACACVTMCVGACMFVFVCVIDCVHVHVHVCVMCMCVCLCLCVLCVVVCMCMYTGIHPHTSLSYRIEHIHTERFYSKDQTKLTLNKMAPERDCVILPFLALFC